jgi:Farnesoic acid 0-methyl transferase
MSHRLPTYNISYVKKSNFQVKVSTPDILTAKEYHAFWIKWDHVGMVDVGRAGTVEPFMSYKDPTPFPINHYGLRTCWGATGKWKDHEGE